MQRCISSFFGASKLNLGSSSISDGRGKVSAGRKDGGRRGGGGHGDGGGRGVGVDDAGGGGLGGVADVNLFLLPEIGAVANR